jgi:CCR4-NOT transcription complex subunit 7/8
MRGHQSARQQQPPQQPPQQQPGSAAQSAPAAPPVPAFSLPLRQQSTGKTVEVRQVWRENLDAEFRALRGAIQTHRFVALDVEFPGVVARSIAGPDTLYETLRCNVDLLSPIQVAFALANEAGQSPSLDSGEAVAAWQFNFRFSLSDDLYATSSIEILERAGVNFNNLLHHGIDPVVRVARVRVCECGADPRPLHRRLGNC